jgi:hypothetical protein
VVQRGKDFLKSAGGSTVDNGEGREWLFRRQSGILCIANQRSAQRQATKSISVHTPTQHAARSGSKYIQDELNVRDEVDKYA